MMRTLAMPGSDSTLKSPSGPLRHSACPRSPSFLGSQVMKRETSLIARESESSQAASRSMRPVRSTNLRSWGTSDHSTSTG